MDTEIRKKIESLKTSIGIEFGSTRVKSVLVDLDGNILAKGSYTWENKLDANKYWTYDEDEIFKALRTSYRNLKEDVKNKYDLTLKGTSSFGVSAMMHGYLAFDKDGNMLVPFRTWRNNYTSQAARELSELFEFNIPERWSIAHFYQAILNGEDHVKKVDYITTLAGYIHWKLTGEKVLGIDDASGMFPIDVSKLDYDGQMLDKFDRLVEAYEVKSLRDILPRVMLAGQKAGRLTDKAALLIDDQGDLNPGAIFAPPEGDAGTGMVATNCVAKNTANVSAGTSAFAMIVLDEKLKSFYPEIDVVTTPTGKEVAMVHTNNCTSEINSWVHMFEDFLELFKVDLSNINVYEKLFTKSNEADDELGDLLIYGFHSGENILDVDLGLPMLIRKANSRFNLANIMKANIISAFAPMKVGLDILNKKESIRIENTLGHGGIFNTPLIAQDVLSAIMNSPVSTLDTANEGGAWGMALLALYSLDDRGLKLEDYLDRYIFKDVKKSQITASEKTKKQVDFYMENFEKGLYLARDAKEMLAEGD
ncbi:MAG: FGGY-family carbohydrate kinase [Tissierellia bacterium]|nr:FGGY-family carbohydrate kinase [Tissierellia bacterium]